MFVGGDGDGICGRGRRCGFASGAAVAAGLSVGGDFGRVALIADLSQQRFRIPLSQVACTKSGEKGAEKVDGMEDECGGFAIKRRASGSVVFKAFFEFVCETANGFEAQHAGRPFEGVQHAKGAVE